MRWAILFSTLTSVVSGMQKYDLPCDEIYGGKWKPSWMNETQRDDLRCKQDENNCKNGTTIQLYKKYDTCCACRSCAVWEGNEIELYLEFISVLGKSLIIYEQESNDTDVFKINYTNNGLKKLSSNLCNWDKDTSLDMRYSEQFENIKQIWKKIVILNFENNNITTLTDLSCLENLDEINMNHNKLTYISNTSFTNLTHLRKIYFSGNLITKLDPGILTAKPLNIFEADFSNNNLTSLDVSNMFSLYPFCDIGFESNEITQLVNEADFKLDTSKTYGPGYVLFNHNNIQTFPDFKELLHLDNIAQLGHLLNLGFNFGDIPFKCDCHLESFQSHITNELSTVLNDVMNVTCAGPPELKGQSIYNLKSDQLTCNLSADSGCHTPECNCIDRPSEDLLFINCSITDDTQWLDSLPEIPKTTTAKLISLDISGHKITDISDITQLSNIAMLNASNNNILEIDNDVAKALENATVDLSNNPHLRRLPKLFLQYRNVCTTYLKHLKIECDCDSLWIETWLKSQCINKEEMFDCLLPNGDTKPALQFRSTDIDCSTFDYIPTALAGVTVFFILISIVIYKFRYELLITFIRLKQVDRSKVLSKYSYDVFLSFNDADEDVTKWVNDTLENNLVAAGYRVFQAGHDISFGAERNSEVLETINKTCNFLLILSNSYLEQDNDEMRPWTENEWKYGWYNFLRDKYKNLIIINFDHVSSFDVDQPQIKAFLRVGCTMDFKSHDRKIFNGVCKKLGKPFYEEMVNARGLKNRKPKLTEKISFTASFDCQSNSEEHPYGATPYTCQMQDYPSRMKYQQNQSDLDIDDKNEDQRLSNALREDTTCHLYTFHDEVHFKKTPNKPLFNKAKLMQSKDSPTPQTSGNTKELSQTHKQYNSVEAKHECVQKSNYIHKRLHSKTKLPHSKKDKFKSRPHNNPRGEDPNFAKIAPYNPKDNVIDSEDIEDENALFQLNMSMTNSETSLSGVSNNDYLRYDARSLDESSKTDTGSLGESTNTSTTSIGSSIVSFNSETFNNNCLTEISNA